MDNKNNNHNLVVCEMADYAPTFYGNFMASFFDLENKIKGMNTNNKLMYAFYPNSKDCYWAKEMLKNNKNIHFIKNKRIMGFLDLKKIIKDNKVNILHLHFTIPVIICVLLKLFFPYTKIIAHYHNTLSGTSDTFTKILKLKIKIPLYNKLMDMNCGVSEAVLNDLVACGIKRRKCCYIDNGVDFSRLDIDVEDGKKIYNIQNKKVIMIYGTHFHRKGVDIAIHAIKEIVEEYNIVLMIVCQNKDFVSDQIKEILGLVPQWIIIVPSQENIAFYFKMSDIYLTPSREEGFSYALLESIYCGTPAIRSNHPAMDRKIPDETVVPVNNINALRQSIISTLNLTDTAKHTILEKQKEYIVQQWNVGIWSENIINMYLNAVNI
jgi:glycosyltransferase involved in cell wall biosynthesis